MEAAPPSLFVAAPLIYLQTSPKGLEDRRMGRGRRRKPPLIRNLADSALSNSRREKKWGTTTTSTLIAERAPSFSPYRKRCVGGRRREEVMAPPIRRGSSVTPIEDRVKETQWPLQHSRSLAKHEPVLSPPLLNTNASCERNFPLKSLRAPFLAPSNLSVISRLD